MKKIKEIQIGDLCGKYRTPSSGFAKYFLEIKTPNRYKIDRGNLAEINRGNISLKYDKVDGLLIADFENLGLARLTGISDEGFHIGFSTECKLSELKSEKYWKRI